MTDDVTPPPGFTLAPSGDVPTPPPGFTLATPEPSHPESDASKPRGVASDIVHGTGMGAVKGAAMILGFPSDVWQLMDRGYQNAVTRIASGLGLITPEQGEQLRQPVPGFEDYHAGSEKITEHLMKYANGLGADTAEPTTVPGQYAETMTSFLPGAAAFGAGAAREIPGALLKYGVIPGAASETAGQLTKGTAAEPYARVAGAIGPAALGLGASTARMALSPTRGIMAGVTPAQEAAAQQLLEDSRAAGAPLTVPEAIQQVTGSGTRAGDVQRVVEQSPQGAAVLRPFMAERPGQTEALGRSAFDQIAPAGADPYEIAPRVQGAAQRVLDTSPQAGIFEAAERHLGPATTAEEAGNVIRPELQGIHDRREGMRAALADQDYAAARADDYTANGAAANPVQVRPVIDYVDDLLTSAKGATAAALRRARATMLIDGQPDMSVRGLDNARKAIASQVSMAARTGNSDVVRVLGPNGLLGQLDSALEQVPAYGQARRNFARASEPLAPFSENTAPGRIIDQDQFGRNYTMPTERVAPTIERGGPAAADQFLAAAENSPRAREAFGQYFSRQLLGSATDARGVINPDILTNALRQNQDMLRRFPEIEANLNRVGTARRALQTLEETPIGALADTAGKTGQEQFAAQRSLLFNPSASLAGGERTIGRTVSAIAEHDPDAAQQFVRQHLEQAFNEATQDNISGANQWGGPKFAATIAGNSQQARNLEAAVRALPDGDTRWRALRNGLDIMEGMGKRQFVGSQTEFNAMTRKLLSMGNPAMEGFIAGISPGTWPSLAKNVWRHVAFNRNTGELAKIFTEGNVADLRDIARAGKRSFQGQAAMIAALARQGAGQPQIQGP